MLSRKPCVILPLPTVPVYTRLLLWSMEQPTEASREAKERMGVEDDFRTLRQERIRSGGEAVPSSFQGVSKERIKVVLAKIQRDTGDMIDVVFALLPAPRVQGRLMMV